MKQNKQEQIEINKIYQNEAGEYFESVDEKGVIVLKNPSYPFAFLPNVQQPLKEIGDSQEFKHLLENKNYQFHDGETLTVEVKNDGLEVVE